MSVQAYARSLGCTECTIRRWITTGLPAHRTGNRLELIPDEADAWVRQNQATSIALYRESVVYFARRRDGAIKIGFSSDVKRRTVTLRVNGHRVPVKLLAVVPGDPRLEGLLLRMFADECIEGEWHRGDGALAVMVEKLAASQATRKASCQ